MPHVNSPPTFRAVRDLHHGEGPVSVGLEEVPSKKAYKPTFSPKSGRAPVHLQNAGVQPALITVPQRLDDQGKSRRGLPSARIKQMIS